MANAKGKEIDITSLSFVDYAASRLFIHRDYLAHCLRYSHVARYMREGRRHREAHVLDVGCGKEVPLPRLMFSAQLTHTTGSYTGVDHGPLPWPQHIGKASKRWNMELVERCDFVTVKLPRKAYDVVVSLEVLEHVEAKQAFAMLKRMRAVLTPKTGRAFVSTPCYDPRMGAADNHVSEMSHRGFRALIEASGFSVEQVWGTFASQRDYKDQFTEAQRDLFEQLKSYYDSEITACLFAPLFPELARNCLWRLAPAKPKFLGAAEIKELATPEHGSSKRWAKDLTEAMKSR